MNTERTSFLESVEPIDERFEALKQLYPEVFSDGKINLDKFKDITNTSDLPEGEDKTPGYYGLYWPGKRAAKQLAKKPAEGTLEPVPGDGVNENSTNNIYIEGDNLEVLRILKQSYKGRVKMIYIDPPYNTGEDFIYPDDFKMPVEEYLKMTGQIDEKGKDLVSNKKTSGAFHTNWLNMMLPRLELAKELLSPDGVIFISIDDNEQCNLKLLCDEVFGEENFIEALKWKRKKQPSFLSKHTAKMMEYVLVYAKDENRLEKLSIEGTSDSTKKVINVSNKESKRHFSKGVSVKIGANGVLKAGKYKIKTMYVEYLQDVEYKNGKTINEVDVIAKFSESQESIDKFIEQNLLFITKNKGLRREVSEEEYGKRKSITDLLLEDWGDNQESEKEQIALFGKKCFSYTKPLSLLKNLIKCNNTQENTVLDFFSGSSSTAQAVFELCKDDLTQRKFIMVQLPEDLDKSLANASSSEKETIQNAINLCDSLKKKHTLCEVAKERIRRAGLQINEYAELNKNLFTDENTIDTGFKVYRLSKSNFTKYQAGTGTDEASLQQEFKFLEDQITPLVENWDSNNVLTEIILRQGFALDCSVSHLDNYQKNTIYKLIDSEGPGAKPIKLIVCLDKKIEKESIQALELNDDEKFICLDSAIDDESFAQLSDKGKIETI